WEESQGKVSNSFLAVDMLGDVYVSDSGPARIQKFSGIGEFITEWGLNGALTAPAHIQVDREGFVYVIDGNAIKKFRPVTDIGSEGTIGSGSDDCDYSITPAEEIFGIGGGTASISVTPADTTCEWSAVSSVAWIVISSDSLGVGTGTVSYSVAPNDEMQSRQGSILVAGYQVVIKQNTVDMPEIICPVAFVLGEDDPRIDRLRQIRDDVLAHTAAGRSLISLYYEHSAALNEILSHNPVVQYLVKEALDSICIFGELLPKHGS
ncbi:MAG: hypothetical protein GY868_04040, partial [Deltaproteobacteria bacterium]|nr:hypothetical protein [Deltaproteobacteria bacterium]